MSNKERRDDSFIKKPVYPGGTTAFRKFIKDNLKYPKAALSKKIEGVVSLKYSIDHKGNVVDTKVVRGIGHGCDKEAERIIKMLKFDIPKGPRKLRVLFHKKTQITFRLPKVKKKMAAPPKKPRVALPQNAAKTRVVYQYQPTQKKKDDAKAPAKRSYTYTISGNIKDLL